MQRLWVQSILAFLCCVMIFSFMLGARPLNSPDETRYSSVSLEMLKTHDYITPRVNSIKFLDKPILFYWVQTASIRLFGLENWSLRLTPALFACIGCLAIFLFAASICDRKTAWLAGLMLSSSPLYFFAAHYINMDMAIAVFITLCLCCFYQAENAKSFTHRKLYLYGFYVFAALGFLTKGLIGFVLPGLVVLIWIIWQRQWSILKWIFSPIGIFLFLIISLPWLVAVQRANPDFFHYFFIFEQFDRFSQSGFNNMMPWWFYLAIIGVTLLPWSLLIIPNAMYFIRNRSAQSYKLEKFLITWIGVVLVFFSIPHSKIITYILPLVPPLILLLTRGTMLIANDKKHTAMYCWINWVGFFLLTIVIAMSLYWYNYYQSFIMAKFYIYITVVLCALTTLINYIYYRTRNWLAQIIMTGVFMLLLFAIAMLSIQWPTTSIAPIGKKLQAILKPGDTIATYDIYPYELAFYINRPIVVIANWDNQILQKDNWKGHFWYGATPMQKQNLLLTESRFWQLWASQQSVYVLMNLSSYEQINKIQHNLDHVIAQTSNEILIENH